MAAEVTAEAEVTTEEALVAAVVTQAVGVTGEAAAAEAGAMAGEAATAEAVLVAAEGAVVPAVALRADILPKALRAAAKT